MKERNFPASESGSVSTLSVLHVICIGYSAVGGSNHQSFAYPSFMAGTLRSQIMAETHGIVKTNYSEINAVGTRKFPRKSRENCLSRFVPRHSSRKSGDNLMTSLESTEQDARKFLLLLQLLEICAKAKCPQRTTR